MAVSSNNEGLISEMLKTLEGADTEAWKSCLKDPKSNDVLKSYAKLGDESGVRGTPTIYVNGKKLDGGANFLILKAAHDSMN